MYLGALTAVMQQSVAYLLNSSQVDQINAQIGLVRQQIVTELAKTDDVIPADLAFNSSTSVLGQMKVEKELAAANIAKTEAATINETNLAVSTVAVNDQQISKMSTDSDDQRTKLTHEVALMDQQKDKLISDATDQHDKITSDIAVNDKQIVKITQDLVDQERTVDKDLLVKTAQIDKMNGEVLLLGQKTISELANTCDTIPLQAPAVTNVNPWLNTSANIEGNLGKQNALYEAQKEGFARDAEQKLAKIMVDTWSVRMASDGVTTAHTGLIDTEIEKVLIKAKSGIGVESVPET